MDSRLFGLRPYRQSLAMPVAAFVVAAVAGIALWRIGLGTGLAVVVLRTVAVPLALLAAFLLIGAAAAVAAGASQERADSEILAEEPLLAPARMPIVRRYHPLIAVVGLAPRCGASTLTSGLAILVATHGRLSNNPARRPRTLCLLNRPVGPDRLQLDANALTRYLSDHPTAARDDLVELTIRHPSGAEFLSCAESRPNGFQLRHILPMLRRYYDLIVFDVPSHDRWLRDAALELADAVLLVTMPSVSSAMAMSQWSERIRGLGFEGKTILTINARQVGDRTPHNGFEFLLELPEEPSLSESDGRGSPWALGKSDGAQQFRTGFRLLLPRLFGEGNR